MAQESLFSFVIYRFLLSFLFPSGEANRIEFYLIVFSCPLRVDSLPKQNKKKRTVDIGRPWTRAPVLKVFLVVSFLFFLESKKEKQKWKKSNQKKEEEKVKRKNKFFIILCVPVERFHWNYKKWPPPPVKMKKFEFFQELLKITRLKRKWRPLFTQKNMRWSEYTSFYSLLNFNQNLGHTYDERKGIGL
jgi:hypothetical protein